MELATRRHFNLQWILKIGLVTLLTAGSAAAADTTPPEVQSTIPTPGSTVHTLTDVTFLFSEAVDGIDAGDVLVNGASAESLMGSGSGPYVFSFDQPPSGTVQVEWAPNHAITDTADPPNAFEGGSWTYDLDYQEPEVQIVINEILASNGRENDLDEFEESSDWIELYNAGPAAVNLAGYTMTDDPSIPDKWVVPRDTVIGAGHYLIIWASGRAKASCWRDDNGDLIPDDLDEDGVPDAYICTELHTNFMLDSDGGYLGLYTPAGAGVAALTPAYPEQRRNFSYGRTATGEYRYFYTPSPGAPNTGSTALGIVRKPRFDPERGIYDTPVDVTLYTPTEGATIYVRTDPENRDFTVNSEGRPTNGSMYEGPIRIEGEHGRAVVNVRALAFKSGYLPSRVVASSYVFPDHVLTQPRNPDGGFPSRWVNPSKTIDADYEMDPDVINNPRFTTLAEEALREVPSVLITMDVDDLFGSDGIYVNADEDCPDGSGANCRWERSCSAELLYPDQENHKGTQVNCGIRMQGGSSRHSIWKVPKLSFRLTFRDDYGPTRFRFPLFPDTTMQRFNTIVLDAKLNQVWIHSSSSQHDHVQYVREIACDDWQNMMGGHAAHNIFVNLYINGLHWGLYDVHERCDHNFAASYLGGRGDDYDCIKHRTSNVINPDPPNTNRATSNWNSMFSIISASPVSNTRYREVLSRLDPVDFADYMLMNIFVGNSDWSHQNWYATHHIVEGKWRFHSWDAEHVLKIHEWNRGVSDFRSGAPKDTWDRLRTNAEFRLTVADRIHKHFFNGGVFYVNPDSPEWDSEHPENNMPAAHYMKRIEEIDKIIVLESARWGDYRLNPPGTRDDWLRELDGLLTDYFPRRSGFVFNGLKALGLYPDVGAPVFAQHGGTVPRNYVLDITRPPGTTGTIYYTKNGSDPRVPFTGVVAPGTEEAGSGEPVGIYGPTTVKARIRQGSTWSPMTEAFFTVPSTYDDLQITEVMYNPPPPQDNPAVSGEDYEFLELYNMGIQALDLSGLSFVKGIFFSFAEGTILLPDQYILLVSDADAFTQRYPAVQPAGVYSGRLDNDTDELILVDARGNTIFSFQYGDGGWWPRKADGEGHSLVPLSADTGEPESVDLYEPWSWRASDAPLGSPGTHDGEIPATPPYIRKQPRSVTVKEGQPASFSVVAGGFPRPAYQWQKNGVDIEDAVASQYTTPPTAVGDDGTAFRCIISNEHGTVPSDSVTLTVLEVKARFVRGDVNMDGQRNLADPINILEILFASKETENVCLDSMDINDDGTVNLADPVRHLMYLFGQGEIPPEPFNVCGFDPTPNDELRCPAFPPCD